MINTLGSPRSSCTYKLGGAETFRASSAKILGLYGGNLQNVAKGLRKYYLADPGKLLCQVDQSGAEAKIVAYLARKGKYRKLFDCGIKPHSYTAMTVFLKSWEEIMCEDLSEFIKAPIEDLKLLPKYKKLFQLIKESDDWPGRKRYYFIGKKLVHASSYGMKGPTFALSVLTESEGSIRLSVKDANHYLDTFHAMFPEIHQWHMETEATYKRDKCLRNLFGFPWHKKGTLSDELLRKLYAFVPQSTVGCITHIAVTRMQEYIEENKLDWDILNNMHDSYLVQAPETEIRECARVMQACMNQDLVSLRGEHFKMASSASIGKNWGPFKAGCNEEGLVEL